MRIGSNRRSCRVRRSLRAKVGETTETDWLAAFADTRIRKLCSQGSAWKGSLPSRPAGRQECGHTILMIKSGHGPGVACWRRGRRAQLAPPDEKPVGEASEQTNAGAALSGRPPTPPRPGRPHGEMRRCRDEPPHGQWCQSARCGLGGTEDLRIQVILAYRLHSGVGRRLLAQPSPC